MRNHSGMTASVYSRALLKASDLVGGRERLAKLLQVPKADLDRWIADQVKPPREVFLRIVDLILDETAPAQEAGPQDPPPPRDAAGGADRQR
jgi:hypothetical protein